MGKYSNMWTDYPYNIKLQVHTRRRNWPSDIKVHKMSDILRRIAVCNRIGISNHLPMKLNQMSALCWRDRQNANISGTKCKTKCSYILMGSNTIKTLEVSGTETQHLGSKKNMIGPYGRMALANELNIKTIIETEA